MICLNNITLIVAIYGNDKYSDYPAACIHAVVA